MSEKRIIRRRRAGSTGSDSEEEEEVVLSGASQEEGVIDKSRQLGEEKAHMEMFVSMNGPVLVRADPLLKRAMDKFFKDKNPRGDGAWHMYHSDETRFYPQDESKTIRRLQKEKSKLGFVDEEQ